MSCVDHGYVDVVEAPADEGLDIPDDKGVAESPAADVAKMTGIVCSSVEAALVDPEVIVVDAPADGEEVVATCGLAVGVDKGFNVADDVVVVKPPADEGEVKTTGIVCPGKEAALVDTSKVDVVEAPTENEDVVTGVLVAPV